MTEQALLPWDRQPDEPETAYSYFAVYRDLGRTRTVAKAASEVNKSRDYTHKLAARWRWLHRAQAFDREQDRLYGEALAERRREMAERHAKLASALQAKVVARLQSLDPSALSTADVPRWLEVTARLERLALGLPDSATALSSPTGGPVEMEVSAMGEADRAAFFHALISEARSRAGDVPGGDDSTAEAADRPDEHDEQDLDDEDDLDEEMSDGDGDVR